MKLPQPAAQFLPHKPPMLFVQTLTQIDADTVTCETVIDDDTFAPFFAGTTRALPATFLIEIIAQTIGTWAGYHDTVNNRKIGSGLLLSCRNFTTQTPAIPHGTVLRIHAKKLIQDDNTGTFEAHITDSGALLASATLTTHQTDWETLARLLQ